LNRHPLGQVGSAAPTANSLFTAWTEADDAWMKALKAAFPRKNAGDVRYTSLAKGEPGTELRAAYDAFHAAGAAWRKAYDNAL
jgi:hypothetical protein